MANGGHCSYGPFLYTTRDKKKTKYSMFSLKGGLATIPVVYGSRVIFHMDPRTDVGCWRPLHKITLLLVRQQEGSSSATLFLLILDICPSTLFTTFNFSSLLLLFIHFTLFYYYFNFRKDYYQIIIKIRKDFKYINF